MLHVKIDQSLLHPRLKWALDASLESGVCHQVLGANGAGKTTFLTELKLHWARLFPALRLGFCDQAPITPFQDLTVEAVMNVLWDITPERHLPGAWDQLEWWKAEDVQKLRPRLVSELSGGENQWLKFLMMRSLESDVWMLDEPFTSLDRQRQQSLQEWMHAQLALKKTVLVVNHGPLTIAPLTKWVLDCGERGINLRRTP